MTGARLQDVRSKTRFRSARGIGTASKARNRIALSCVARLGRHNQRAALPADAQFWALATGPLLANARWLVVAGLATHMAAKWLTR